VAIYYIGFPLLTLVAVLDATLMHVLGIWGGLPSLLLVVVVSWGLLVDLNESLPWAVMGGVLNDLLSVVPTGSSALALVIIIALSNQFLPRLSWRNWIIPPVVVGLATFVYYYLLFGILALDEWPVSVLWGTVYIILPSVVLNMLATPLIYRTMGSIYNFLRPSRTSSIV
jgi:rod shape-determining protein MreD